MSASTMPQSDGVADAPTERVSTREVREAALRGLRAAGASAGEADAVGTVVLESEIQGWGGLDALVQEIHHLGTGVAEAECRSLDGTLVVDAPSHRGPLLLGRSIFDLAAAQAARTTPASVFVRGLGYHRVLLPLALEIADRTHTKTVFATIGANGEATCTVACTGDGRVVVPTEASHNVPELPFPSGLRRGLAVSRDCDSRTEEWHVVSTPAERGRRRADALHHGFRVRRDTWDSVYRAAQRFLVVERRDDPTEG